MVEVAPDLPATITRWCCRGKSCGNTTLHLVNNDSPAGWPPLYDYVRGNGTSYAGWQTEEEMHTWLSETRDSVQPEEGAGRKELAEAWAAGAEMPADIFGDVDASDCPYDDPELAAAWRDGTEVSRDWDGRADLTANPYND